MARRMIAVLVVVMAALGLGAGAMAEGALPIGTVVAVTGAVQVGRDGVWKDAAPQLPLFDGQTVRAAEGSSLKVLFEGSLPAAVAGKVEIAVADLLLKARLEKARAKITVPSDGVKAEMQVTPLTGVRGTEQGEEKAGELKREHYWNESAPAAK